MADTVTSKVPRDVEKAMRGRTKKGIAIILETIERYAPELTEHGHPVRRVIRDQLYDIEDINHQLVDTVWDPEVDVNLIWLLALSDLSRRPEPRPREPDGG